MASMGNNCFLAPAPPFSELAARKWFFFAKMLYGNYIISERARAIGHIKMENAAFREESLTLSRAIEGDAGKMLTGTQMRAARAMLRWRLEDLAERSGLSFATVQRAEAVDGLPAMTARNLMTIKTTFEKAGIIFLDGDYTGRGGPGVRLRRR
jgi:hypothetical protein